MRRSVRSLAAVAAVAALGLAACTGGTSSSSSSDAEQTYGPGALPTVTDGKLTVATSDPAYSPWILDNDPASGEGYESAVIYALAEELGYSADNVQWVRATFDSSITPGAKDWDLNIQQFSITDERKKVVSFAGPYFVAGQDLLVRKDETSIKGPEDLNGKRLCSVTGSTSAVTVKEKFANEVQLMEQPGYAECATALFSGIVDAVTTDDIILAGLASASRGRLRVVGKPFTQEYYGVGIKKGDMKLATQINNAIADMIQDGSWQRAISDNTKGTAYTPNAKYNPPEPTEGER